MKEFITILVILILIFGGAYITRRYLNDTTDELMKDIDDFQDKVLQAQEKRNKEEMIKQAKFIKEKWDEIEQGWGIIVLHNELDNIKSSICKLNSNAEYGEFADCLEEVEKLRFFIEHIKEKEEFSLINIF